jgi:hypothetical protein
MDILNPPKNYIDFRCAVHGKEGLDLEEAKRKFYKAFDCEEEIKNFCTRLQRARNEMLLPVEKVQTFEGDHKKHGNVESLMIFDIEYWREGGAIKHRKIYMRLQHSGGGTDPWIRDPDRKKDYRHHPDCPYALSGWDKNLTYMCCRRRGFEKEE